MLDILIAYLPITSLLSHLVLEYNAYCRLRKVDAKRWEETGNPFLVHSAKRMWFLNRKDVGDSRFHVYKVASILCLSIFIVSVLYSMM